jgi:hypothetical protein
MQITVGFKFMAVCFPLSERGNWIWGREGKVLCLGPMRFSLERVTADR